MTQGSVTNKADVDKVFAGQGVTGVVVALGGKTSDVGATARLHLYLCVCAWDGVSGVGGCAGGAVGRAGSLGSDLHGVISDGQLHV